MKSDDTDLSEQLRRDAARVRESESFDARLHQDTLRQIRQLGSPGTAPGWARMKLASGIAAAAVACWLVVISLPPGQTPAPPAETTPAVARVADPKPASALAYRQALADGEEALLAMLDRDARVTLPRSANPFQITRL